jgi:hypothetical protein
MWGKLNEAKGKGCIVAKALLSIELSKRNQARTMLLIVETLQRSIAEITTQVHCSLAAAAAHHHQ